MKATRTLTNQHDEVREMFRHLKKGNGHTGELVQIMASTLVAHMLVEQELFYPASLSAVDDDHPEKPARREERVLEFYEDHATARYMIERLVRTAPADRTFTAKLITLQKLVLDHFEEEEEKLFSKVEKQLGEQSAVLAAQMDSLFERTKRSGYAVGRDGAAKTASSPLRPAKGARRVAAVSE